MSLMGQQRCMYVATNIGHPEWDITVMHGSSDQSKCYTIVNRTTTLQSRPDHHPVKLSNSEFCAAQVCIKSTHSWSFQKQSNCSVLVSFAVALFRVYKNPKIHKHCFVFCTWYLFFSRLKIKGPIRCQMTCQCCQASLYLPNN